MSSTSNVSESVAPTSPNNPYGLNYYACPPGDVFNAAMPVTLPPSVLRAREKQKKKKKADVPVPVATVEKRTCDPFKDWMDDMADVNRMNLKQMLMRTDE